MPDAIAYVNPGEIGYVPLAKAIIAKWKAEGVKPTAELYGEELVTLAREIWKAEQAEDKSDG